MGITCNWAYEGEPIRVLTPAEFADLGEGEDDLGQSYALSVETGGALTLVTGSLDSIEDRLIGALNQLHSFRLRDFTASGMVLGKWVVSHPAVWLLEPDTPGLMYAWPERGVPQADTAECWRHFHEEPGCMDSTHMTDFSCLLCQCDVADLVQELQDAVSPTELRDQINQMKPAN